MKKPLIGIVLDHEPSGGYASFPWYALRENYFDAVSNAGGVPLAIPYAPDHVGAYASLIQGLLIPGGDFDIDPSLYGKEKENPAQVNKAHRTHFELQLTRRVLDQGKAFLGICAGMQLLNVLKGGTLHQDIARHIPDALTHEQITPKNEPSHSIEISVNTSLHSIAGTTHALVNSTHHQAIDLLGKGLIQSARAPDGVVECIEDPALPFCMGVEWHPEYQTTDLDRAVFASFIKEAARL